ncbi:MAG: hypothetical protein OHK0038_10910 [Flammeovirgaceae bacterium]
MKMSKWFLILLVGSLIFYTACEVCEPTVNPGNKITLKFYKQNKINPTKYDLIDTLFVVRVAGDEIKYSNRLIYPANSKISQKKAFMRLPLDTQLHQITLKNGKDTLGLSFVINLDTGKTNLLGNLKVTYQRMTSVNPPNCGYYETFSNLSVLEHNFDSVRLVNTSILADTSISNIDIFIK